MYRGYKVYITHLLGIELVGVYPSNEFFRGIHTITEIRQYVRVKGNKAVWKGRQCK